MTKIDPMSTESAGDLTPNLGSHKYRDGDQVFHKGDETTVVSFFNGRYSVRTADGVIRTDVPESELSQ